MGIIYDGVGQQSSWGIIVFLLSGVGRCKSKRGVCYENYYDLYVVYFIFF